MSEPRRTPLYDRHCEAKARMVTFAGWEMPVRYTDVIDEHRAVRERAGLFDVSHMGEIKVTGPGALAFLQGLTPNNVARLKIGRAHYSGLLTEHGTYIDDILIYRQDDEAFLLVVNAGNHEKDLAWILDRAPANCTVTDISDRVALLALQGPRAEAILRQLTRVPLDEIPYYGFVEDTVDGRRAMISRTGYTGEDGFELYTTNDHAVGIWDAVCEAGAAEGLLPAGLGARDTLRLEAGMALYGHEIDDTRTPYDAGLGWVVKLKKGDFVGRDALVAQKAEGPVRRLIGFTVDGRGIAREGAKVQIDGATVGVVTSGTFSPTLEKAIGTAYVPVALSQAGQRLQLTVRKRVLDATVAPLPFYKRS